MKNIKTYLFCCIVALLIKIPLYAQDSNCTNLGFELGNFSDWTGYSWVYTSVANKQYLNTTTLAGIASRRQTIMSDTTAYDANTGYGLKMVPSGYKYSARLGDGFISTDRSFRCWHQSLRYTMTIDSANALLIMKFACVLQYASDHFALIEPRFRVMLYDQYGNIIPDCSNYDVYSSNDYVKGFRTYIPNDTKQIPVKWRDWTTVGADLSRYIGQTITVEFMSADCERNFHFGYAYFVAGCHPLNIAVKYCAGDSVATLTAPEGFEKYSWTNSIGITVSTEQFLNVIKPLGGETYTCTMTSATGCIVPLNTSISKYLPKANFSSYMIDCNTNIVQFINSSTKTIGSLEYKWDFYGEGPKSYQEAPRHTFKTSGLHPVMLTIKNPPSTCVDTLKKIVESFSPPLVGIASGYSTYCPGDSVTLRAYGAYSYTWNNMADLNTNILAEAINVSSEGTYRVIGRSSVLNCSDTTIITITQEPDWNFLSQSDTTMCEGDSTALIVSGANQYLWNNSDTTNSIIVNIPATYSVTGANKRGCRKTQTFHVIEYPIPDVGFSTSTNTLDKKHNLITCTIPPQTDIQYEWNMGDSTLKTGSTVEHSYTINNNILQYTISQKATSIYNCIDSTYKIIDVIPFVPNIFSPNDDGTNDIFMPGNFELKVFDRNGLVLYQGTEGWDGKHNGQPVDPDTYFYSLGYKDRNQQTHIVKGYITLVR